MHSTRQLRAFHASTSKLEALTPNEKKQIIKAERDRRRLIRYIQVRQQSRENALKIREKVKMEKLKEIQLVKQGIADEIARRAVLRRTLLPVEINVTEKLVSPSSSRRRRKLTEEELRTIAKRNEEALIKIKRLRKEQQAKVGKAIELKRKAVKEANLRSNRTRV